MIARTTAAGGLGARWRDLALAAIALSLPAAPVAAQTRLNAHYTISMIGVAVGQIVWVTDFGAGVYTSSASGKASGALSVLVNGEGRAAARGSVQNGHLAPSFFSSHVVDGKEVAGLQMTFENGGVKTLRIDEPLREDKRLPVPEAERKNVSDPLSGMLFGAAPGEATLSPASCGRTLPVFDGQRRYDLVLSYKRIQEMKIEHGYAGPALVCSVVLQPIAGYRPDSMLVKYVGGRPGMELWFAPIDGTAFIAPVRLSLPTVIGTLDIDARRFEALPLSGNSSRPLQNGENGRQ